MAKMSDIFLTDASTGQLRQAELWDGIEERHIIEHETKWAESQSALLAQLPPGHHEESSHWKLRDKVDEIRGLIGSQTFAIECDGETQGIIFLDLNQGSWFGTTRGESIVYVDYLQVAPWNRRTLTSPRFVGVGTVLMSVAANFAIQMGFDGRVGLHSLPQSESFYRRCGMTEFWRDPEYQCLLYFEMPQSQSTNLLAKAANHEV